MTLERTLRLVVLPLAITIVIYLAIRRIADHARWSMKPPDLTIEFFTLGTLFAAWLTVVALWTTRWMAKRSFRNQLRAPAKCHACGYSLAGLTHRVTVCPECGRQIGPTP